MDEVIRSENFEKFSSFVLPNPTPLFSLIWYQKVFAKHFCQLSDLLLLGVYQDDHLVGYGIFEKVGEKVVFGGMKLVLNGQSLTDYGDIVMVNPAWKQILAWLQKNNFRQIQLDYVREDSETFKIFQKEAISQEVAPYITLPSTWEEYLASLDRVERKELKRKMKRAETISSFHLYSKETVAADFEEFVRLHRLSDLQKEKFMSEPMKAFFWDLLTIQKSGWEANLCFLKIEGKNAAAVFSFENATDVFAYNSGYDQSYNYYSAGLLLHAYKIKKAIEEGKKRYDFLRGGQRYKYDLGGKNRQLYQIKIRL